MKQKIDYIVCICLMVALYINWTDFPKPKKPREVSGPLVKIGVE